MRSGFLLRPDTISHIVGNMSQSLLNEVWFPTNALPDTLGSSWKSVAIPSKWGLVSYEKQSIQGISCRKGVAIPSKWGLVSYDRGKLYYTTSQTVSQSLLNEVWFPTSTGEAKVEAQGFRSQSLLNEVWFPTHNNINISFWISVAIPSKWGLVSYNIVW